jgi:hypothetical protein
VTAAERRSTSAEPTGDPWDVLRLCQRVVYSDWLGEIDPSSIEEVVAAALGVEAAAQERLVDAGGEGADLDRRYGRALWVAQWNAHAAVVAKTSSRKLAKEIQARAARGAQPLTVCVGYVYRRLPEHVMRFNAPDMFTEEHLGYVPLVPLGHGDGCGHIIADSIEPRAPKRYCERCAARAGRTLNAGLAKNALARLRRSRR